LVQSFNATKAMATSTTTPRISQLAERLEAHIKSKGLRPGDRFLTTAEASKLLGVSSSTVNRALQLLERRRVIVRQQRRGAFVAHQVESDAEPMLHRVHFLVHQKYLRAEGVGQDEVLLGLEHELPGVPVQISFLPVGGEAAFVTELVKESVKAKRTDGFVLVRASYETQRLLSQRQIPTVVYGTVYPAIDRLASLSANMRAVGAELTKYLLDRGHKRLVHFNRQTAYCGDLMTIEGITSTLQAAGFGFDSLHVRFLPHEDEVYAVDTERYFDKPNPPTGFICRTVRMADAVAGVATMRGLVVGRDIDITVCDCYLKPGMQPHYVYAKPLLSSEDQGRRLAQLLIGQTVAGGRKIEDEIMPVTLEFPVRQE
jgi:DNA-binding LacI/PurR family transcriptional regulator